MPRDAPLSRYRAKRDFTATPEPGGGKAARKTAGKPRYVIQRHQARRLHYDFRLELGGVLVSWAVPKGPSLDPEVKRLAVHVEDHPLEYGSFEGDIPAGHYGAGHVDIWDSGTWTPRGDPVREMRKGRLHFELEGGRLGGGWILIRTGGRENDDKQWLLRKLDDAYAQPGYDAETETAQAGAQAGAARSGKAGVDAPGRRAAGAGKAAATRAAAAARARPGSRAKSGTPAKKAPTRAGVAAKTRTATKAKTAAKAKTPRKAAAGEESRAARPRTVPARKPSGGRPAAGEADLPDTLAPQLATLVSAPPANAGWAYEIKYDGYRILCRLDGGQVRLISRNGLDWTPRMARLAKEIAALELGSGWLDGEVVVLDERGQSSFQALQIALDGAPSRLRYVIFDLPFWNGVDLRPQPLSERQALLAQALEDLPEDGPLSLSQVLQVRNEGDGEAAWHEACRLGWEGLVGKRLDAPYVAGRSATWIKLKCRPRQEFVVGGYSTPTGSRSHLGSLLLGLRENGKLVYAGRVGSGFDSQALHDLYQRLQPLRTDTCPFSTMPPATTRYRAGQGRTQTHWVKPELVAEINFTGWTADNLVRQASFQGLREDKPALAVHAETPASPARIAREASRKRAARGPDKRARPAAATQAGNTVAGVAISHPSRPVFSTPAITKLELARYYETVGPAILPHVRHRRLALLRCPEGSGSPCFFQKHLPEGPLPGLREDGPHIVVDSLEGLIALVQRGVIELHTWGSTLPRPDRPDRITIDLDPDPALPWSDVVDAARLTRTLIEGLGLTAFLKTTGGKGLHVVAPLRATQDWSVVRAFCKGIASYLARFAPDRFTANMAKARRKGMIFADYLRNGEGATAIAAYAVRARQGAPVSVPVAWDELDLEHDLRYDYFNVGNAPARASGPDPWEGYAQAKRAVTKAMLQAVEQAPAKR